MKSMNTNLLESSMSEMTSFVKTILIYSIVVLVIIIILYVALRLYIEKLQKNGKLQIYKNKFYNSKLVKMVEWFLDSGENLEKKTVNIYSDSNSKNVIVECSEDKIVFYGRRRLIVLFFYKNKNEEKSYHDFNAWLGKQLIKNKIRSSIFGQDIKKINERLKKESNNINQIIELNKNSLNNKTKSNFYKYKVKLKD